jgi:short-chain fatty acids transporter
MVMIGPLMHPKKGEETEASPEVMKDAGFEPPPRPTGDALTPALRLEHSPLINMIVGLCGLIWLFWYFGKNGFAGINLDVVNFTFLIIGIILHRTPASLLKAPYEGGTFIWGSSSSSPSTPASSGSSSSPVWQK